MKWKVGLFALVLSASATHAAIHGSNGVGSGTAEINFTFSLPEAYANLAKGIGFGYTSSAGFNPFTQLNSNQYVTGTTTAVIGSNPIFNDSYYGHYHQIWTGTAAHRIDGPALVVYSGGRGLLNISPALGNSGIACGHEDFQNSTAQPADMNVEFAFGVLITAVGVHTDGNLLFTVAADGATTCVGNTISQNTPTKLNNLTGLPTGPNFDGSWTARQVIDFNHFELLNSAAYVGLVSIVGSGGPGVQTEAIQSPSGLTYNLMPYTNWNYSNWIFCRHPELAGVLAGNLVASGAINFIKSGSGGLGARWARFMGYMHSDTGALQPNLSDWVQPGFSGWGSSYLANRYGGVTTNVGDAYTASNPSGSPGSGAYVDGETVQVQINSANTTVKPTLALSGRSGGARPIRNSNINNPMAPLLLLLSGSSASILSNASVSGNGTTVTVTTSAAHGLTNGAVYGVTLSGVTPSSFNANAFCTVTGTTTFTCPNATNATASVVGSWQLQTATNDIISITFAGANTPGGSYTFNYYVNTGIETVTASIPANSNIMTVSAINAGGVITPGQAVGTSSAVQGTSSAIVLPYGTGGTSGIGQLGTYAVSYVKSTSSSTAITTIQGPNGPEASISNINSNLPLAIQQDDTLLSMGLACGNNQTNGQSCVYQPSKGDLTVTSSTSGTGAEAVSPGTLPIGTLALNSVHTLIYNAIQIGWIDIGATGIPSPQVPLAFIAEVANRANTGWWMSNSFVMTQASYTAMGAAMATLAPSRNGILEKSNEVWNNGQPQTHILSNIGSMLGFFPTGESISGAYSMVGLLTAQMDPAFKTAYAGAGGNVANVRSAIMNWALEGTTNGGFGAFAHQTYRWNGRLLTTAPGTFTATVGFPSSAGIDLPANFYVIQVASLSTNGIVSPGFAVSGTCIPSGSQMARQFVNPAVAGSGTGNWVIYSPTAPTGTCTATLTNAAYAAAGGPDGTSTSTNYNAFPTRPIDITDGIGYATYFSGALANGFSTSWTGPTAYFAGTNNMFQAGTNYATGVATSNATLISAGYTTWDNDLVSGTKNGIASSATINFFLGHGAFTGAGNSIVPGYEAQVQAYDGAGRPSGKANLSVWQYEGASQETFNNQFLGTTPANAITFVNQMATNATATQASFTGAISGTTTLTVTGASSNNIAAGETLLGAGVTSGTTIVSQLTGTAGGNGTYSVSISQTASGSMSVQDLNWANLDATYGYPSTSGSPSTFSATSSGTTLTVTGTPSGVIYPTTALVGAGLTNSPFILAYGTGATTGTGAAGTYALNTTPAGTSTFTGSTGGSWFTSLNMVNLWIAYANTSPQFYHTVLCFFQQEKAISSDRPEFSPSWFGIDGAATATSPGTPLWGLVQQSVGGPVTEGFNAIQDFDNGVTATCP